MSQSKMLLEVAGGGRLQVTVTRRATGGFDMFWWHLDVQFFNGLHLRVCVAGCGCVLKTPLHKNQHYYGRE